MFEDTKHELNIHNLMVKSKDKDLLKQAYRIKFCSQYIFRNSIKKSVHKISQYDYFKLILVFFSIEDLIF